MIYPCDPCAGARFHHMMVKNTATIASLSASLLLLAFKAQADIRLPRLIGDDMVLQRDAPVTLWGWADPHERIEIEFVAQRRRTVADADGYWSVRLAPLAA